MRQQAALATNALVMTLPGRWSRAMIQSLLQNAEGEQVKSHEELRNRRCFSFWTYWTATGPSILSRTYWTATGPSILPTATGHGHMPEG